MTRRGYPTVGRVSCWVMAVDEDTQKREVARRQAADRTYGIFAGMFGDRRLSDELIAERREEARRESLGESSPPRR